MSGEESSELTESGCEFHLIEREPECGSSASRGHALTLSMLIKGIVFKKEIADIVKQDLIGMLQKQLLQICASNEISREMSPWWTEVVF